MTLSVAQSTLAAYHGLSQPTVRVSFVDSMAGRADRSPGQAAAEE